MSGRHTALGRGELGAGCAPELRVPQPLRLGLAIGGLSLIYLDCKRQDSNR